jgi:hypothetical protein
MSIWGNPCAEAFPAFSLIRGWTSKSVSKQAHRSLFRFDTLGNGTGKRGVSKNFSHFSRGHLNMDDKRVLVYIQLVPGLLQFDGVNFLVEDSPN